MNKTSYPREKINVLLLENINNKAVEQFKNWGYTNVEVMKGALSEDTLIEKIQQVHILGIRSKTNITKEILSHATKLKAIGCFCIGTNQVDLNAAQEQGIVVFNAPYSNTRSVAELVIGNAILLIRKIIEKNTQAHLGNWLKEVKGSFEIRGKTIGIIGYGNIGMQVSVLAEAIGMHVIFYDAIKKLPLGNAVAKNNIEDILKEADIVTLHLPETTITHNLINETRLKLMKQGAILINYARGTIVDLNCLKELIESRHLSGVAIDVFPEEPEKAGDKFTSPLQNLPNVILTPHIGGSTEEAQVNIGEEVSLKLIGYLEEGTTTTSYTIPEINLSPVSGGYRILHIHKNVPGVLSSINTTLSKNHLNILAQYLKTNEHVGYVVLDIDQKYNNKEIYKELNSIHGTIKTRILF